MTPNIWFIVVVLFIANHYLQVHLESTRWRLMGEEATEVGKWTSADVARFQRYPFRSEALYGTEIDRFQLESIPSFVFRLRDSVETHPQIPTTRCTWTPSIRHDIWAIYCSLATAFVIPFRAVLNLLIGSELYDNTSSLSVSCASFETSFPFTTISCAHFFRGTKNWECSSPSLPIGWAIVHPRLKMAADIIRNTANNDRRYYPLRSLVLQYELALSPDAEWVIFVVTPLLMMIVYVRLRVILTETMMDLQYQHHHYHQQKIISDESKYGHTLIQQPKKKNINIKKQQPVPNYYLMVVDVLRLGFPFLIAWMYILIWSFSILTLQHSTSTVLHMLNLQQINIQHMDVRSHHENVDDIYGHTSPISFLQILTLNILAQLITLTMDAYN